MMPRYHQFSELMRSGWERLILRQRTEGVAVPQPSPYSTHGSPRIHLDRQVSAVPLANHSPEAISVGVPLSQLASFGRSLTLGVGVLEGGTDVEV